MKLHDLTVGSDRGSILIPKSSVVESELTLKEVGYLILDAWRGSKKRNNATGLSISYYYYTEKDGYVFSWRPAIEGRTGW